MKISTSFLSCLTIATTAVLLGAAQAAPADVAALKTMTVTTFNARDLQQERHGSAPKGMRAARVSLTSSAAASPIVGASEGGEVKLLPLWTFNVRAVRDGQRHQGTMVGTSPFDERAQTTRVPTFVVPLIVRTHTVATGLNTTTGFFTTAPGDVTIDPTAVDAVWLTAPNNVPTTLLAQSPLFQPAPFTFGNISLGTTQYIDALQRGSFYKVLGERLDDYHLFLEAVTIDPVVVDVPPNEGLAITDPLFFGPPACCAPFQFVDINWLDSYINGTLLPRLARQGIGPATLPVFLLYNSVIAVGVTNYFGGCCIGGYHSLAGRPTPTQAYAVTVLDESGFFGPGGEDTAIISHELGEFANDPFTVNLVPPWGHTGQVGGCQNNLEVGDPLTGTLMPPVTMPNGHTYQLQELTFFSWFFGGSSVGANGWYSSNGTFTTDAGPICP